MQMMSFWRELPLLCARIISRPMAARRRTHRRNRALTGKPVIKAIKIEGPTDMDDGPGPTAMSRRCMMYDAKAPETLANALPGGNGMAFDWSLLGRAKAARAASSSRAASTPAMSAEAIEVTGAPIVDVSSGVETAPGVKDARPNRKFIEAAKAAR